MDVLHHPHRRATDLLDRAGDYVVDLRQVIYALADALDLVGIDDVGHGKRVGIMAAACARTLGLAAPEEVFLFDLGMLHDIGVSSTATHSHLVTEFDWEGSQVHCGVGHALLRDFAPLAAMAQPILHHHTRWDVLRANAAVAAAVARQANLIFLVDRVDALAAPHYADGSLLMHAEAIRARLAGYAGNYFAPDLVEAFLAASASEAFWLQLEPRAIQAALQDMLASQAACRTSMGELRQLAQIFSRIVDAKSPFTAQHSLGVARLARHVAAQLGCAEDSQDKIEIAGLLHDLGKLRVPDEILDKPAALDPEERKIIQAHSFETFQILHRIRGFEEIAAWAAYHHEEPDGNGYPFRVRGRELPLEARILRVADIFQAMVQDRPYRPGLPAAAALAHLEELAGQGRVETEIVAVIAAELSGAMAAAMPATTPLGLRPA